MFPLYQAFATGSIQSNSSFFGAQAGSARI